jgi:hypothetical protein
MKKLKPYLLTAAVAVVAVALVAILVPKFRDVLAMGKDGLKSS